MFKDVASLSSPLHGFQWEIFLVPLYINILFFMAAFKIFSLSLVLRNLIIMCNALVSSCLFCLGFVELLDLWIYSFNQIWKHFSYFFIILLVPHCPASPMHAFVDPDYNYIQQLRLSHRSMRDPSSRIFCTFSLPSLALFPSQTRGIPPPMPNYTFTWASEPVHLSSLGPPLQ